MPTDPPKHSLRLLGYASATFVANLALGLIASPAGATALQSALPALLNTAGGIAGNVAAEHFSKVRFDEIRSYFFQQPKGTDIANHDLLKAYQQAVVDTLDALYANYDDNLAEIYKAHHQKFPTQSKKHLAAVKRKMNTLKAAVEKDWLQTMIAANVTEKDLKEYANQQSDALTAFAEQELNLPALEGHGKVFARYFKNHFGHSLQLYFGEQLKNNPQAWVAFQRLWMQEVLQRLSQLDELEEKIRGALGYEAFKIRQLIEQQGKTKGSSSSFDATFLRDALEDLVETWEQNRQAALQNLREDLSKLIREEHQTTRQTMKSEHETTRNIVREALEGKIGNKYLTAPPFAPPKNFLGREKDLKVVRDKLQNSGNVVLVNGIGGVGKTTLAQVYWQRHQGDYDYLAWFTVLSDIESAILNSGIEQGLGLSPQPQQAPSERLRDVWRKLANLSGKQLLVIDNANDSNDLSQQSFHLPNAHILLTSRSSLPQFTQHAIGVLPLTQAKALFCRYYPAAAQQNPLLEKLLQAIGRHTLTIELLAKNLQQLRGRGYGLQALYDNLQEKGLLQPNKSLPIRSQYVQQQQKRYEDIIRAMFELQDLEEYAKWLLLQFAVLSAIPIDYALMVDFLQINEETQQESPVKQSLFKRVIQFFSKKSDKTQASEPTVISPSEKKEQFDETLNDLVEKGWLELEYYVETAQSTYKMHQVVQEVIREKFPPTGENCGVLVDSLIWKLRVYAGDNPLEKAPYLVYADRLLFLLVGNKNEDIATLYNNASDIYRNLGNFNKALHFQLKSIEIEKEILEPKHPSLATSYNNIALIYCNLGDTKKALHFQLKSIEIEEEILDPKHPSLATSYGNIALTYRDLGDTKKALYFQLKSIDIQEAVSNQKHPLLATFYGNIALIYRDLGDLQKALEFQLKSIAIREEILDPKHPSLATSYNNIALTYSDLGDTKKALEFQLKSIAIREEISNPKHPSLATSYGNIALTYSDLGDTKKALHFQLKDIEIEEEILDPKHPSLATSYGNIALTYRDLGDTKKALHFQLKSIEIRKEILDPKHPSLATSYGNIALIYHDLGKLQKALDFQLKSIGIQEAISNPKHPLLATFYGNIALTYQDLGDMQKALGFQLKTIEIEEAILDPKHPSLALSYMNIAGTYYRKGELLEAKRYIGQAVAIFRERFPDGHPHLTMALEWQEAIDGAMG